jgi:glycosyltransferase involved in cell wall biosynthesis
MVWLHEVSSRSRDDLSPITLGDLDDEPLVSVLMPSFNYGRYIEAALESVRSQTYATFEVVVCDDGSTDDSVARVRKVSTTDDRFRLITQTNAGQAAALNAAFDASRGSIIALLDADDRFAQPKLAGIVDEMRGAGPGAVLHPLRLIDAEGTVTGRIPNLGRVESGWIADAVVRRGGRWRFLPTSALSFRREIGEAIFPLPVELRLYADAFLFVLLPLLSTLGFLEEPLADYRVHGENATLREADNVARIRENAQRWLRVTSLVNDRLAERGVDSRVRLDPRRNPEYRQREYLADLLEGRRTRVELLRSFARLAPIIFGDDVYSPAQRAVSTLVFALAPVVPVPRRGAWVDLGWRAARIASAAATWLRGSRRPT